MDDQNAYHATSNPVPTSPTKKPEGGSFFCGIEDAARVSRQRELRAIRLSQVSEESGTTAEVVRNNVADGNDEAPHIRKKLRWRALVDSGMGERMHYTCLIFCLDLVPELGLTEHVLEFDAVPSISTDNSAALLTESLTHFDPNVILAHDTRGYVRCGGAIYGQRPAFCQLRAVSTLSATVKHVATIKRGESVGYDRAYVAPLDVRIATLTVGFADGYPCELGNRVGRVSIWGEVFPVAGNVCMDMLMGDLGPADDGTGPGSSVAVGDMAVLWGPEETNVEECGDGLVPLADLAATLKTTQSALTCGLDKLRVQRQLVE